MKPLPVFDECKAAEETWQAMLRADVFTEGNFTFASGINATLKVDAEKLYDHPRELAVIMGHFALHPSVQNADVLLYVPNGMKKFTVLLGDRLGKPVAHTMRNSASSSRYDFRYMTSQDERLARTARTPLITEDIVTTLGSVAGVRRLLRPEQRVFSLAILLRGAVNRQYQEGIEDHYLLTREIPTDKNEFRKRLAEEWS